ncbi:hypothetical protein IX83_05425 [Basilea psittacipulmonis DSM 24701]|uniref:Mop domain-containing protein n=2 Tax=Basilea TaxID=1472344 RepID=A0A077DDX6_9BURK|nr:hypothetical protein IX83_05425 [Basilea psittacipulmonis DSM 24701]
MIKNIHHYHDLHILAIDINGLTIYAELNSFAYQNLSVDPDKPTMVFIKAPHVSVMTDLPPFRLSAENQIKGIIKKIETGAVNTLIELLTESGHSLFSVITVGSCETLQLKTGQSVYAVFRANQVVIAQT